MSLKISAVVLPIYWERPEPEEAVAEEAVVVRRQD